MGYSLSWCAVRGKEAKVVLDELGLHPTGEREAFAESPLVAAQLPSGWYVIVADHDERFQAEEVRVRLSLRCEMVSCDVEEHVMYSAASGWQNGQMLWSVEHAGSDGLDDLHTEGQLPAVFPDIRARLQAELAENQRDADYLFDVPIELAKALVGYRHDEDLPASDEEPFEVLAEAPTSAASVTPAETATKAASISWLKRLFGGR